MLFQIEGISLLKCENIENRVFKGSDTASGVWNSSEIIKTGRIDKFFQNTERKENNGME
jgi:hypothetical protein